MDIASYIVETLETHESIAVKGLGTLTLQHTSAQIDAETQTIAPPKKGYSLSPTIEESAMNHLIQHICKQRNLSEPSANYFIDKWVEILKDEVNEKKVALRKPLGYFTLEDGQFFLSENNPANAGADDENGGILSFVKFSFGKKKDEKSKVAALKEADESILHTSAVDETVVVPAPAPRDEDAAMAAVRELLKKESAEKARLKKKQEPGFFSRLFKRKPKAPKEAVAAPEKVEKKEKKAPEPKKVAKAAPIAETVAPVAIEEKPIEDQSPASPIVKPSSPKKPMNKKLVIRITALVVIIGGFAAGYVFFGHQISGLFHSEPVDTLVAKTDTIAPAPVDTATAAPENDFSLLKEGTRFQIIIGSYDNPEGANAFMQKQLKKGIKGPLHVIEGDGRFRIAAGGFTNLNKTKAFLGYYQEQVATDSWILQL